MKVFRVGLLLKNKKAILLLEVCVSMLILGIGILFILHTFSSSLKAAKKSLLYTKCLLLLEERVWKLKQKAFTQTELEDILGEKNLSWDDYSLWWNISKEDSNYSFLKKFKVNMSLKKGREAVYLDAYVLLP